MNSEKTVGNSPRKSRTPSDSTASSDQLAAKDLAPRYGGELRLSASAFGKAGLKSPRPFFNAMPTNGDMGFVVIQHLDPTRNSILPELLARETAMAALQVEDGMRVEPHGKPYDIIISERSAYSGAD